MKKLPWKRVLVAVGCGALGAGAGAGAHCLFVPFGKIAWTIIGGLIGLALCLLWSALRAFAARHRLEDWRLKEVEAVGVTFTSAGAQRRVAWRLFVQMATRISTQPMEDDHGDDGVALKSLYDLFILTRDAIAEMAPTPKATGDTVETFALDMLNSDLRPFLSKWHPIWDKFAKDRDKAKAEAKAKNSAGADAEAEIAADKPWPEHGLFRENLKKLQAKIETRARGLAGIAGVEDADRFFQRKLTNGA